ncbi:CTLH/CRA C-terminal to LisH motif domain [Dillenia turbinata]|uniref:CTLH/CRA C-terminal to LisH motif domain n=1 Tax=Dillenia turbinata TaxID=194707 RepID=A0AAN8VMC7_9MAGN
MEKESLAVYTEGEWYAKLNGLKIAAKEDMNRLVMNFFVIEGYASTAAAFQKEAGVDQNFLYCEIAKVDLVTVGIRTDIMNAISDGDIKGASQLLRDFYPNVSCWSFTSPFLLSLLEKYKSLSNVEIISMQVSSFHLNKQTLIELIRVGDVNSVFEFAVDHIVPWCVADESLLMEIEEVLGLLAFELPSKSPLGDLLSQSQRTKTACQVNAAILAVLNPQTGSKTPLTTVSKH